MQQKPLERHWLIDLGNSSLKAITLIVHKASRDASSSGALASEAKGSALSLSDRQWSDLGRGASEVVARIAGVQIDSFESVDHWFSSLGERSYAGEMLEVIHVASVNPPSLHRLLDGMPTHLPHASVMTLSHADFPLQIDLDFPDRLGLDRLAAATAAQSIKSGERGVIVIDAGTATTVDAVSVDGKFLGGAILASSALMLKALGEHTRLLPTLRDSCDQAPPAAIGRNTEAALRSGAFWGQVGAIQTLIDRQAIELGGEVQVMICGGVAGLLGSHLVPPPQRWPGLVLAGIAIAASKRSHREA